MIIIIITHQLCVGLPQGIVLPQFKGGVLPCYGIEVLCDCNVTPMGPDYIIYSLIVTYIT